MSVSHVITQITPVVNNKTCGGDVEAVVAQRQVSTHPNLLQYLVAGYTFCDTKTRRRDVSEARHALFATCVAPTRVGTAFVRVT